MRWPAIERLLPHLPLPPDVLPFQLARTDLSALHGVLADWHPDILIGEEQQLLSGAFYEERAALRGEEDRVMARPVYVLLLRSGAELVGLVVLEYEAIERFLLGRLSVVARRWRGRGLGRTLLRAGEAVGRSIGANLVYGFAELDNLPQCALLEKEGYRLDGIIPDSERRRVTPGVMKYVPEGLYMKTLIPPEDLFWPCSKHLTPRVAALFQLIAPSESGLVAASGSRDAFNHLENIAPPELEPSIAALLAVRPGGAATWPDVALLSRQLSLSSDFELRQLTRGDISRVLSLLPIWFPDLARGFQTHLLDAVFYNDCVALAGENPCIATRPAYVWLLWRGAAIAAMGCFSYDLPRHTLRYEFGTVNPQLRTNVLWWRILTRVASPLCTLIGRAIKAETLLSWVTLRHQAVQRVCEHTGWGLWGLIPSSERYAVNTGVLKYGFEALYGISLVPPELSYCPALSSLPPHRAALVSFVRANAPAEPQVGVL